MPNSPTPVLGLTVPTVGGDLNNWGNELNTDLGLIDELGVFPVIPISANYTAIVGLPPETIIEVTTGSAQITVTLPTLSATFKGKVFTIKKVDAGAGSVLIVPSSGTIDGSASWTRAAQYSYLRVYWDGSNYGVCGNN